MALLKSDNQVDILIKTSADTKGVDQTSDAIGKLGSSGRFGAEGLGFLKVGAAAAAVAIAVVGAGIVKVADAGVRSAAAFEQNRVALETMLGSASKARSLLGDISEFAKATPFELPEVVTGAKQLLAYGFAQQELLPTMSRLGDIASGLSIPFSQIANVYGQVRVAGKLMGQDLLQFTQNGVPLLEYLSQTMGKTTAQIKKDMENGAGPTFENVRAAIEAMTNEGSRFGGLMEKQSHTFNGVVSNIKDGFGQILRGAVGMNAQGDVAVGSLFDRIRNGALAVMPVVQRLGETVGPTMIVWLDKLGRMARETWATLNDLFGPSVRALADTIATKLMPQLQRLWQITSPILIPMLKLLGGAVLAGVIGGLWLLINALNAVITVISTVVGWINTMQEAFMRGLGNILIFANNFVVTLIDQYRYWTYSFNIWFVEPMKWLISLPFREGWAAIQWFGNTITGFFAALPGRLGGFIGSIRDMLIWPFNAAFEVIKSIPDRIVAAFASVGSRVKSAIGSISVSPVGALKSLVPGFATGGYTGAGASDQIAGVVHKGEYVVPKNQVNQSTGRPMVASSGNSSEINFYGDIHLNSADAVDAWYDKFNRNNQLAQKGMTPVRA